MKKVQAIIPASSLEHVMDAVDRYDVSGFIVTEVTGSGDGPGLRGSYRGSTYAVGVFPELRVEVVVADAYAGPIAWAIATAARTGRSGDAAVSIETVEEVVRIRTGERGVAAVSTRIDLLHTDEPRDVVCSRRRAPASRMPISDWTKVLVTNVALATAVVVLVFHAPMMDAGLGAAGAGLVLWVRERRAQARRAR